MLKRGSTRDVVLHALLAAKYDKRHASDVIDAAWRDCLEQTTAEQVAAPVSAPTVAARTSSLDVQPATAAGAASETHSRPLSAQLVDTPNSLDTSDRAIEMLFVMASPRVVLFGNLLSDDECDLLIEQSRNKLQRSSVVNTSTGAYDVHPHRTSSGTHFKRGENELISRIEQRIAELVDCPLDHGEPIQVLHYRPGASGQSRCAGTRRSANRHADHVSQ